MTAYPSVVTRWGPRDALVTLDRARANYLHAARLRDVPTIGDPLAAMIRAESDIRAARRSLRAAGWPIPARPRTRHAKETTR